MVSWPCQTRVHEQDSLAFSCPRQGGSLNTERSNAAPAWTSALGGVMESDTKHSSKQHPAELWVSETILFPTF